jgi:hypothetical protein
VIVVERKHEEWVGFSGVVEAAVVVAVGGHHASKSERI